MDSLDFKVKVIDNFLADEMEDHGHDFQRVIKFRFEKYQEAHGKDYFPLELIDFFSRQYFIETLEHEIIMCMRFTPIPRCKRYALEWPLKRSFYNRVMSPIFWP